MCCTVRRHNLISAWNANCLAVMLCHSLEEWSVELVCYLSLSTSFPWGRDQGARLLSSVVADSAVATLCSPEHYSMKGWIVPRLAVKGESFNVQIHSAASTRKSSSTPCNSWIDQRSIRSALLLPGTIICASCRSSRYVESNIVYELKQNLKTSYGS